MSSALDKALDEIVQDKTSNGGNRRPNQRRRGNFRSRSSGPRDGVSKSSRGPRDPGRGNWAHDKYDESDHSSSHRDRGRRGDGGPPPHRASTKVRVEQLHYDIGEKDLNDVFSRVGNIVKLEILYDRAGRSEGVAYVTYSTEDEAELAIDQFDGANAHGQPISVKLANARGGRGGDRGGGGGGSGGFGNESNPLFDRIKPRDSGDASADEESRSAKRSVAELRENAQTLNIDRYIPGDRGNSRDRRGGQRRGGGGGGRGNERERRGGGRDRERRAGSAGASAGGESRRGGGGSGGSRPKKTVEELDAEMNSYWGTFADTGAAAAPTEGSAPAAAAENPPAQQQQATNVPTTNVTNFDEEMTDL